MGFVESMYNVLSPGGGSGSMAVPWIDRKEDQKPKNRNCCNQQRKKDQQQQGEPISLDCRSWILEQFKSSTKRRSSSSSGGNSTYKRPPKWKRLLRKCRVETRKMKGSCYDTVFVEPQPLHHYKTESYERNFDQGREYWHDLPFLDISPFYSPVASRRSSNVCSSSYDSAQQQQQQQSLNNVDIFSTSYDPWQRRLSAPPPSINQV